MAAVCAAGPEPIMTTLVWGVAMVEELRRSAREVREDAGGELCWLKAPAARDAVVVEARNGRRRRKNDRVEILRVAREYSGGCPGTEI